jgi:hypothetical protein
MGQAVPEVELGDHGLEPRGIRGPAREVLGQRDVLLGRERGQQVERLEDEAEPVATEQGELAVRQAMQCSSVDLPDPDGPMIAVNWPRGSSRVRSSRAFTAASPVP